MSAYGTKLGLALAAVMAAAVVSGCEDNGQGAPAPPPSAAAPTASASASASAAAAPAAFAFSTDPAYYTELYRPQYHLSPESGNMSDPNGMVFFGGEYHQFYQNSGQWGHAVSTDLIHWTHLPVALLRDPLGEIWSGSAVVDEHDTSGFFGGKPGLVAIFTQFLNGVQSQSIAYSADKGRTWTKYEGNPVIPNPGLKDFRDPKVIWYEPTQSWVMVVSVDNRVRFYSSKNLKAWTMTGEFGADQGSHAAVWECPDLFELPVEGTGETKWVLAVSIGGNDATKGSTAQYFVGAFDGMTFANDNPASTVLWTDYGKDFYAAVSYSGIPAADGRRIWLGWMSNWRYPFQQPTDPWKGNMTIPRELKLRDIPGEGLRMIQRPVRELEGQRGQPVAVAARKLTPGGANPLADVRGTSYELEAAFTVPDAASFSIRVRKGQDQETAIRYDAARQELTVDRTRSGVSTLDPGFAETFAAPLRLIDGKVKLHLYVDESTLEVFGDDGEAVLSAIVFPEPTSDGLAIEADKGDVTLDEATFYPMKPVWRDEDPNAAKPQRVRLGATSLDVPAGGTASIAGSLLPLALPQRLVWSSSDESVAKVQAADGGTAVVSGLKEGQATLTAASEDGAVRATADVFVYKP